MNVGTSPSSRTHKLEALAFSHFSRVRLFATPWTSSPGSSAQRILHARILECVATPFPKETFPTQGWNSSLKSPALAGRFFTTSAAWKALEALKGPYSGTSGVTSSALMRGSLHHKQVRKHKPSFCCVPPAPAEARLPSCPDQNSSLMPEMFQDMLPQNMSLWRMDYFKLKAINPQLWEKL